MASALRAPLRWFAAALAAAAVLTAQSQKPADLGIGKLLVSPRKSPDPSFAESVILLLHYNREAALGLIINRRTTVPIARVLRDFSGLAQRPDVIYLGGPVERASAMALVRTGAKPDGATAVTGRVYLLVARQALEKALATGKAREISGSMPDTAVGAPDSSTPKRGWEAGSFSTAARNWRSMAIQTLSGRGSSRRPKPALRCCTDADGCLPPSGAQTHSNAPFL